MSGVELRMEGVGDDGALWSTLQFRMLSLMDACAQATHTQMGRTRRAPRPRVDWLGADYRAAVTVDVPSIKAIRYAWAIARGPVAEQ